MNYPIYLRRIKGTQDYYCTPSASLAEVIVNNEKELVDFFDDHKVIENIFSRSNVYFDSAQSFIDSKTNRN